MKILYLAHRIPFPPNKGDKIRSFNEVKYLSEKHEVDLICLADDRKDLQYEANLRSYCKKVFVHYIHPAFAKGHGLLSLAKGQTISVGYFYRKTVQRVFDRWVRDVEYDAIVCFSSTMAEYVFRSSFLLGEESGRRPKLIMDFCDVDSDKWVQYADEARFPLNFLYGIENRRLATYERKIDGAFDHSVVISQKEAELFYQVCPQAEEVAVIPNGVDSDYFQPIGHGSSPLSVSPDPQKNQTLVFTGAMDYHANVDGVCWFCREVFPLLKGDFPNLQFYIVGSKPVPAVQELGAMDGVTVTGFVDDIRPYYQIADVCVIPLRLARGVQNKVLEAMAMGKAVVTTSKANAGIQAMEKRHLMVSDSAEAFVRSVSDLLNNIDSRKQLGINSRSFIVENFDWARNIDKLEKLFL